jgi:hypothetical protein
MFQAERAKSTSTAPSAPDAVLVPMAAGAVVKPKVSVASKEALAAAIDMFHASAPVAAPAPSRAAAAVSKVDVTVDSAVKVTTQASAVSQASHAASPVPKLDLSKAVQEQVAQSCATQLAAGDTICRRGKWGST